MVDITENKIKSMFGKFKEFILTINPSKCKKFISDYVKDVIVYRDHIEVIFNVFFYFAENEITYYVHITTLR